MASDESDENEAYPYQRRFDLRGHFGHLRPRPRRGSGRGAKQRARRDAATHPLGYHDTRYGRGGSIGFAGFRPRCARCQRPDVSDLHDQSPAIPTGRVDIRRVCLRFFPVTRSRAPASARIGKAPPHCSRQYRRCDQRSVELLFADRHTAMGAAYLYCLTYEKPWNALLLMRDVIRSWISVPQMAKRIVAQSQFSLDVPRNVISAVIAATDSVVAEQDL
jgi:hypothetical protein